MLCRLDGLQLIALDQDWPGTALKALEALLARVGTDHAHLRPVQPFWRPRWSWAEMSSSRLLPVGPLALKTNYLLIPAFLQSKRSISFHFR